MRFFRKRSDSFQKETRTILEQLQCECTVFSDDSILDEVRDAYKKASIEAKRLFRIKLLGSALLIAGVSCLIYFQSHNPDFIGAPSV